MNVITGVKSGSVPLHYDFCPDRDLHRGFLVRPGDDVLQWGGHISFAVTDIYPTRPLNMNTSSDISQSTEQRDGLTGPVDTVAARGSTKDV